MALASAPSTSFGTLEEIYTSDCGPTSDTPASCLPRSVLHLSGNMEPVVPFKVLWDTGSSHCMMSPATARTLGFAVPDTAAGHGTMRVADGTSTGIYGWTGELRVYPPRHLADNLGTRALITHLPPMQCLVAEIAEDVIVGVNYIKPLPGGFATVGNLSFFRLAIDRRPEAPTVLVPLVGQNTACSVHFEVDDGAGGPMVRTFMCKPARPTPQTTQAHPPR